MPTLTRSDVHVDRPLSNISVAILQDIAKDYIATTVFPTIPTLKQSDRYFVYNRDFWHRTAAQKRAPATESAGSGWSLDNTPTFFADVYAHHVDVDQDTRDNADDPINIDRDAVEFTLRNIKLRQEKMFMARFMSPGVWGGLQATNSSGIVVPEDFSPSVAWSSDNSNPTNDISILRREFRRHTGIKPNTMVVSEDVNERLKQHPLILARLGVNELRLTTEDLLAKLFDVERYIVAAAIENEAQEGQVGVYDFLAANTFLLTYAAPRPGIMTPSGGYTFVWKGRFGNTDQGSRVKTIPMPHLNAERIETELCFDQHLVCPELGVLGQNLLAA